MTDEELQWCCSLGHEGRVPSDWIIEEVMEDGRVVKMGRCNNHVLSALYGSVDIIDPRNTPMSDHGEQFIITRRHRATN